MHVYQNMKQNKIQDVGGRRLGFLHIQ